MQAERLAGIVQESTILTGVEQDLCAPPFQYQWKTGGVRGGGGLRVTTADEEN